MLLPVPLLLSWFFGLLSLAVLGLALWLIAHGIRRFRKEDKRIITPAVNLSEPAKKAQPAAQEVIIRKRPDPKIPLIAGLLLLLWTFTGKSLALLPHRSGPQIPESIPEQSTHWITRPDGTKLRVSLYGSSDAPTVILTHGWSVDNKFWNYAKQDFAGHFRVITWDLPGLGHSTQPDNQDYSLDKMTADLSSVIDFAGKPVLLIGHSIGGMINLTYCRMHPEQLGHSVLGIVEMDTTYKNPATTTSSASFSRAIQKPIGEPLLHLTAALSPLVRVMSWLSYQNGTSHILASGGFAGTESREQLDFMARYNYQSSPGVVARGTLGMLHWDATATLPKINVPVLLIVGRQDTTTIPEASEYMQHAIPGAQLVYVEPAAHQGPIEQFGRYDEAAGKFAAQCFSK